MMARGDPADPEFQMVGAIPIDDWDRWNDSRDQKLLQSSNSYQYVPQGVYGAEDLDAAGTWDYVAPYGYVWRPAVVAAAGRRTATAAGFGWIGMAGLGSATIPGAGRRTTTAGGFSMPGGVGTGTRA